MLVALEGIDGSGKSTQASLLAQRLNAEGTEAILTKEPTYGTVGMLIRSILNKNIKVELLTTQILFTADRNEHIAALKTKIDSSSTVVVTDRYYYSTIAYGIASGVDAPYLRALNSIFPKPDLTVILYLDPKAAIGRIGLRGKAEFFEEESFLKNVQDTYRSEFPDAMFMDGSRNKEEIAEEIYNKVSKLIRK